MMNRRLCHALVIASMCWTGTACDASLDAEQTLTWDNAPAAPVFTEEEPVVDGDAASESEPLAASEVLPTITMAAPSSTPKGSPEAKAMMAAKLKKVTTYKQSKKVFQTMSMFVPIKIAWPPHIPTIENPCADDSCLNGGQCIPGEWRYRCECPRGYTGPRCEFELQQHHLTPSYHAALHPPAPIAPCGDGVCGEGEDGMNCIEDCDGIPGVLCAINDEIYNAVTDSYTAIRYHFDCDGTCRTDSARSADNGICAVNYACDAFEQDGGDCVTCATDTDCDGALQPAHTHPDCVVTSCNRESQLCEIDAASFSEGEKRCGENDEGICWEGACEVVEPGNPLFDFLDH